MREIKEQPYRPRLCALRFIIVRSHAPETAVECETDTLLLPAIKYFSESEILCMPNGRCTARRTWTGGCTAWRMPCSLVLKALLFLQGSSNDEQLYRVNTWLGVVCLNQEEYEARCAIQRGVEGGVEDGQSVLQEPGVVRYRPPAITFWTGWTAPFIITGRLWCGNSDSCRRNYLMYVYRFWAVSMPNGRERKALEYRQSYRVASP